MNLSAPTSESTATILAATDLLSGSRALYTIGVAILVVLILLAGGRHPHTAQGHPHRGHVPTRRGRRQHQWAGKPFGRNGFTGGHVVGQRRDRVDDAVPDLIVDPPRRPGAPCGSAD